MNAPDARIPDGPLERKWQRCRDGLSLVSPANKRRMRVIVVGTGLAGSSAAAALGELGYAVDCFCIQDSPRRAHSVAAQGGINAAKNYRNDGDSVFRLFQETIKGGDFRAREANVYRLAELSARIIDQCAAQGVPFAREYGGMLANRSFGGVQVSRTFYARGATGQQLLLGAYGALNRQIALGQVRMHSRAEMLDLVVSEGRAQGVIVRDLVSGRIFACAGDAVVLATGGYGNVFHLSTNGRMSNATAIWRAYKQGAGFANPCFTQIHPTCIPPAGGSQSKLTLMSESLRNDGRVWVPKSPGDPRPPDQIPESERDYFLERLYPSFGNLVPRDIASRALKRMCDEGRGVGPHGLGVYLDLRDALQRLGPEAIRERYGNLIDMYRQVTGESPLAQPMRIYPAIHYVMGGLWVDYHLMSTIPGLFVLGEANFSDHGANRLGASALMQGLADGYFVLPSTIGDYLSRKKDPCLPWEAAPFRDGIRRAEARVGKLLALRGSKIPADYHKELGVLLWEHCGMARNAAGLRLAAAKIRDLRESFWANAQLVGRADGYNQALEQAGRVADFLELGELLCLDALAREESCGCHFREEHQTAEGECLRDDSRFAHVALWFFRGEGEAPERAVEPLRFESLEPVARSYR
ncbi:fumarate reductase/succinate dehydrogenase flavoprotein subunit [Methylacidimicrobium sp. B4]|uniref:fumarate reductase/succinate dehydrogenase flavoprotein subunit n=1 Tax=Methylacidimicrobium sp. B4 TaxID=2796139 RepID=UPI001A8D2982|nr:fumarate reductase/succinate dehydrogenase flavoprotein subunit [Methylacidimicrobium sp. B4]QSR84283.1 fumarate reductase/succinate dehydrogenase flavoprotein subunit [Methylacidimicrobium sp. B4]